MSSSVAELTEDAVGFDGPWIAGAETDAGVLTAVLLEHAQVHYDRCQFPVHCPIQLTVDLWYTV